MAQARDWEGTIRTVVSHALSQRGCRRGWTVLNHRGNVRLNIAAGAAGGRRRQVLLPIPWQAGSAAEAPGLPTSAAGGSKLSAVAAPLSIEDWSELIEAFRDYKLLSGEIKGSTWERVYRHHMKHVLGAMAMPAPPS